jgi:hypothetical protein
MLHDLSAEELDLLRRLAAGAIGEPVRNEHAARLASLELAKETPEGLAITVLGRAHLAMTVWRDEAAGETRRSAAAPPESPPRT